jgi:hypothetical protein
MTTKNPYEDAWNIQNCLIRLVIQKQDIDDQIESAQLSHAHAISVGEATGEKKIGEYSVFTLQSGTPEGQKITQKIIARTRLPIIEVL